MLKKINYIIIVSIFMVMGFGLCNTPDQKYSFCLEQDLGLSTVEANQSEQDDGTVFWLAIFDPTTDQLVAESPIFWSEYNFDQAKTIVGDSQLYFPDFPDGICLTGDLTEEALVKHLDPPGAVRSQTVFYLQISDSGEEEAWSSSRFFTHIALTVDTLRAADGTVLECIQVLDMGSDPVAMAEYDYRRGTSRLSILSSYQQVSSPEQEVLGYKGLPIPLQLDLAELASLQNAVVSAAVGPGCGCIHHREIGVMFSLDIKKLILACGGCSIALMAIYNGCDGDPGCIFEMLDNTPASCQWYCLPLLEYWKYKYC